MIISRTRRLVVLVALGLAAAQGPTWAQDPTTPVSKHAWDTLSVLDTARGRLIPIAVMRPTGVNQLRPRVVLVSHGYNDNKAGTYLLFTGIAEGLCNAGFVVVSVQHELPGDEPLPMTGDFRVVRRPNWERGVENLRAVIRTIQDLEPEWDLEQVDLVGHSNGGDISMLHAQLYPEQVRTALSMDNRRMPLPRTSRPRIASLRADDVPADPGVIPSLEEQRAYGIQVIHMAGFKHIHFNDRATPEQRLELVRVLLQVLLHEPAR